MWGGTGFGAFSFRDWAADDLKEYREGYPRKRDDPKVNDNLLFYQGAGKARPCMLTIDQIHKDWYGQWRHLEWDHSYIQWLFPIQEHGMNMCSLPLQKHEISAMKADPVCIKNIVMSFRMMLDFYGMQLDDETTGRLSRHKRFEPCYDNLNTSGHNYLRITRMLKCLGEMGLEHLKIGWLEFFEDEIYVTKALSRCKRSFEDYWSKTIYGDTEREKMTDRIKQYAQGKMPQRPSMIQQSSASATSTTTTTTTQPRATQEGGSTLEGGQATTVKEDGNSKDPVSNYEPMEAGDRKDSAETPCC